MAKILKVHHQDHGVSPMVLQQLVDRLELPEGFFLRTEILPEGCEPLQCALVGPLVGDPPVEEARVLYRRRSPDRPPSRVLVGFPHRPTDLVTIIGVNTPDGVVVYTCYGGPAAPREPGDPTLQGEALEEAQKFWAEHALATG